MSQILRKKDWRLTAVLFIAALLGLMPLFAGFLVEQPGHLIILFRDTVFQTDITSKQSIITLDGHTITGQMVSSKEGAVFDLGTVAASSHRIGWTIAGFAPGERIVKVRPTQVEWQSKMTVELKPDFGRVVVNGTDATTNEMLTVPSLVSLGAGQEQLTSGAAHFIDVSPGIYKVQLQAEGYCPEEQTIHVSAGETAMASLALSPSLNKNEAARIILEWNQAPDDLDAHLLINLANEKDTRHVFWHAMQTNKGGHRLASLDVDKRKPGGFETVTIRQGFTGSFVYVVSNYSRWAALRSKTKPCPHMINARPHVRLYINGDCRPRTFRPPDSHDDLEWMVVELVVDKSDLVSVLPPQFRARGLLYKASPRK